MRTGFLTKPEGSRYPKPAKCCHLSLERRNGDRAFDNEIERKMSHSVETKQVVMNGHIEMDAADITARFVRVPLRFRLKHCLKEGEMFSGAGRVLRVGSPSQLQGLAPAGWIYQERGT